MNQIYNQIGGDAKKWIIIIAVILIILVIFIPLIIYLVRRSRPTPGIAPQTSGGTPTNGGTPGTPPTTSRGTGLWAGYPPNGVSYDGAIAYCNNNNASIATQFQMNDAYNKGFQYCASGWFRAQAPGPEGPTQVPASGWMMQQDNVQGCGHSGFNDTTSQYDTSARLAAYCYGPIPSTPEVGAYVNS